MPLYQSLDYTGAESTKDIEVLYGVQFPTDSLH